MAAVAGAVAVAGYAGCLGYGRGRGPETPRALHPGMDTGAGQATERSPAPHSERADGHPVGGNDGRRHSRPPGRTVRAKEGPAGDRRRAGAGPGERAAETGLRHHRHHRHRRAPWRLNRPLAYGCREHGPQPGRSPSWDAAWNERRTAPGVNHLTQRPPCTESNCRIRPVDAVSSPGRTPMAGPRRGPCGYPSPSDRAGHNPLTRPCATNSTSQRAPADREPSPAEGRSVPVSAAQQRSPQNGPR